MQCPVTRQFRIPRPCHIRRGTGVIGGWTANGSSTCSPSKAGPVDLEAGRVAAARHCAAQALDIALAAGAGFAEPAPGQHLFDPVEIQDALSWTVTSGFS